MSYCPNCGAEVGDTHRYCTECGDSLVQDDGGDEGIPPSGSADGRGGFLSGRSIVYLGNLMNGDTELNRDSTEYERLARDVGNRLADFLYLAAVDDLHLLLLLQENLEDADVLSVDAENQNSHQQHQEAMIYGFLKLPEIYDRTLNTEWGSEMSDSLAELAKEFEEAKEEIESGDD